MPDWDNVAHLSDNSARTVASYAKQDGARSDDIVNQSITTYGAVKEALWDGGRICVYYDDGRETKELVFGFRPPRLAKRPSFINWMTSRPVFLPSMVCCAWGMLILAVAMLWPSTNHSQISIITAASINNLLTVILALVLFFGQRKANQKRQEVK